MADQETPESSAVQEEGCTSASERRALAAAALHSLAFLGVSADGAAAAELQAGEGSSISGSASEPAAGPAAEQDIASGAASASGGGASDSDDTDIERDERPPRWRDYYVFDRPVAAAPAAEAEMLPVGAGAAGDRGGIDGDMGAAAFEHGAGADGGVELDELDGEPEQQQQREPVQFMPRGVISEGPGPSQVPAGVTTLEAFQPRQSRPRLRLPPLPRWEDRLERVTLAELRERAAASRNMAYCSLEQLAGYHAGPDDDLQEAILNHGKVMLDPRYEYVLTKPLLLATWCYVVGNGARIRVKVSARHMAAIKCGHYREFYPDGMLVQGVTRCVFADCVFVDDPPSGEHKRPIFRGEGSIYIMDCSFYDCRSAAILAEMKGEVKGCNFYNCHTGIMYVGSLQFEVTECAFQRCVIGVKAPNSPLKITYCCARDCVCLVLMGGPGKVMGNTFMHGAELGSGSVVTCVGGSIQLLTAYHLVSRRRAQYPIFARNHLNEGCMFVGFRRGSLYMRRCHLSAAQMMLDVGCANKVNCGGSYINSLSVLRMASNANEVSAQRQCRCECGSSHTYVFPMVVEARDAVVLPNHRSQPVETLEFCSDSDD